MRRKWQGLWLVAPSILLVIVCVYGLIAQNIALVVYIALGRYFVPGLMSGSVT